MPFCWPVQPGGLAGGSRGQNRVYVNKASLFPRLTRALAPILGAGRGCVCPVVAPLHPNPDISHPRTPREGTRPTGVNVRACRPRALTRRTVGVSIGV